MTTVSGEQAEAVAGQMQRSGKKLERAARKTRKDLERAERKARKAAKRDQKKLQADVTVEPKRRRSGGLKTKACLLLGLGAAAGCAAALRSKSEPPLTLVPDAPEDIPVTSDDVPGQPEAVESAGGRHAAPESASGQTPVSDDAQPPASDITDATDDSTDATDDSTREP